MKVFLSHSFAGDDGDLVQCLERLLSSHNVLVVRGRRLAGSQLTPEIKRLIDGADALVALMTRRDRIGDPSQDLWRTSRWIDYEYAHARDQGKHAIALVENGVEGGGPFPDFEKISFDRANLLEAFLALSETLRLWKEHIGIPRVVQIRPDHIGRDFRIHRDLKCRYRFVSGQGVKGQWVETDPVLQPSGTLLYLNGVQGDDTLIEIEILQQESPRWYSPATSQFISIEMTAWEDGQ
jgi:hypothetical protein